MIGTYGSWVQTLRETAKLDLRTVSLKSGIHFTTINRIEKCQNEPTLFTAINIANALNGDPDNLYQYLTGAKPLLPYPSKDYPPIYPTENDVRLFERLMIIKPKSIGEFIADLLNKIINITNTINYFDNVDISKQLPFPSSENDEQKWLSESMSHPYYSALDIHKFLLSCPPHHRGMMINSPSLNYPENIEIDLIKQAYLQNAVLINRDLVSYISNINKNRLHETNITDNETAQQYLKVTSVKEKLRNQELISSAKLSDILILDQILSDQHEIFMMVWNAAKEEIRLRTIRDEFGAGKLLITLSRFLCYYKNPEPNWLIQLRHLEN